MRAKSINAVAATIRVKIDTITPNLLFFIISHILLITIPPLPLILAWIRPK